MATPLGKSFSTDENVVAQADVWFLRKMVESSSLNLIKGSLRNSFPQALLVPRQCGNTTKSLRKLALESLQKLLLKWPTQLSTAQAVSLQKRFWKSFLQPAQPASMSLKRPAGWKHLHTIKVTVKINSAVFLLCKLCYSRLSGVPNNPCGLTGMLNVDEGIVLVDNILHHKHVSRMRGLYLCFFQATRVPRFYFKTRVLRSPTTRGPCQMWDPRSTGPKIRVSHFVCLRMRGLHFWLWTR